jgi:hypothetical protein
VWGLVGRLWIWPPVAQLSEHPKADPARLLRLLCGFGFSFVAAGHVVVPARPASAVLGCAAPGSGHLSSMAPVVVGGAVPGRPPFSWRSTELSCLSRSPGPGQLFTVAERCSGKP